MSFASPGTRISCPTGSLAWCWSGTLTDTSFSVKAGVTQSSGAARIVVSTNADYSNPAYTSPYTDPIVSSGLVLSYRTLSFDVIGLVANTTYYYQIQFLGAPSNAAATRTVKTAPTAGAAAAFTFAVGSCSHIDPAIAPSQMLVRSLIHQSIALETPLFFFHIDDIVYSDVSSTDVRAQRDVNARLYCMSPDVDVLNRIAPVIYLPGDHDMGPNDSTLDTTNGETIFRNSRTVYRETVPHYAFVQQTLGETNIDHVTLTQQADFGKVRFLFLDCMSQSRLNTTALGQALGNGDYWDQRTWLASALTQAATDAMKWVFVCLPRSWMDTTQTCFNDVFTAERTAICDLIEEANVPVCILYGDAHAIGADDGNRVGSFATDGFARFPGVLASGLFNIPITGGTHSWNGTARFYGLPTSGLNDGGFVVITMSADNTSFTVALKGSPIDETTKAPTTKATVSTADATPAVSFNNAAPTVAHGTPLTVNLDKTWFGACSVHWASSDGQSGNVTFKPNKKRASFAVTFVSAGSPTITLSSPSGCTISGTNPATVTVT